MKKYIITQVQIDKLMRDLWHSPQTCVEMLMTLKPIEPQSKYNPAPVYTSNCLRHPAAPHGVDVDASWRAGKRVCVCAYCAN